MKRLALVLITLIVAVGLTLFAKQESGYVLFNYGPWSVEMSLVLLVIILLLGFMLLYFLMRVWANVMALPRRTRYWRRDRKRARAVMALGSGLIGLAEGRWSEAEKGLIKHVNHGDTPVLHYLAAARAAQELGAHERRDRYLMLAQKHAPSAEIAIGLTQAELLIRQRQFEQALVSLEHLRGIAPQNSQVLKLLASLYTQVEDWPNLLQLLPTVRKRKILEPTKIEQLALRCYKELLQGAAASHNMEDLREVWEGIPKQMRAAKELLTEYSRHLIDAGDSAMAEPLLRNALAGNWDHGLIYLYGVVDSGDAPQQLASAEAWLQSHEQDPMLLLTLGRLCLRNELWGKARQYLELSIRLGGHPEAYSDLGRLLEHLGEKDQALEYYRRGLLESTGTPLIELPKLANAREIEQPAQQHLTVVS